MGKNGQRWVGNGVDRYEMKSGRVMGWVLNEKWEAVGMTRAAAASKDCQMWLCRDDFQVYLCRKIVRRGCVGMIVRCGGVAI